MSVSETSVRTKLHEIGATALVGLIAFPILKPAWVFVQ
jgi:hypothetical protein